LGASRPALTKTSTRFAEAKVLEDDLAQVDKARRELLERVSRLEADEQRRDDRERGIEVGANAYLVKSSFDQSNLLQVIGRLI